MVSNTVDVMATYEQMESKCLVLFNCVLVA